MPRIPLLPFAVISAIALTLLAFAAGSSASNAGELLQGDANCDSVIDGGDAIAALLAAADAPSAECAENTGDVNCDSLVDDADVLAILQYLGGIGTTADGCTPIGDPLPTPTPAGSLTVTPTGMVTATPTPTPTPPTSPTPTATPHLTVCDGAAEIEGLPTLSPSPSPSPSASPSQTSSPSPTSTSAPTPTPTATPQPYALQDVLTTGYLGGAAAHKTELALIPGAPDQAIIALQTGEICRVSLTNAFPPQTWGDLSDLINYDGNEEGLLSVAFSPEFETDGIVYAYYTPPQSPPAPWVTTLSRFQATTTALDEASRETVINVEEIHYVHQGGHIIFDENDYLMLSLGDGGYSGDATEAAQDPSRLLGSVIRIDVSSLPYTVPLDNPFAGETGAGHCNVGSSIPTPAVCDEIFAYGFRNPWRMTMDSGTGEIWLGDVGEATWEEVNHVVSGGNYGWDCYEGYAPYETPNAQDPCIGPYVTPRAVYGHDVGIAIVGGYVYRGSAMPELDGWFIYADYATGRIWGVDTEGSDDPVLLYDATFPISSWTQLPDGELLVVSYLDGIYKLVPQTN